MSTKASPTCRIFMRDGRHYAYDRYSNDVYEIDAVLADLLPLLGTASREGLTAGLSAAHSPQELQSAWDELEQAQAAGRFRPDEPQLAEAPGLCADPEAYASRLGHLCLSVSEDCNLRCGYCLHGSSNPWIRPHRARRMSPLVACKALDYFAARSGGSERPCVTFYGGEPLLEFELVRNLVTYAYHRKNWRHLQFAIATNGTLFGDEVIRFVGSERIRLQISLDGPAPLHDRHRRTQESEGTHARIEEGVERLLRQDPGMVARISFVVTLAPPYDFEAVAGYFNDFPPFRRLGIDAIPEVRVNLVSRQGLDLGDEETLEAQFGKSLARAQARYLAACAEGRRAELGPVYTAYFDPPLVKFHHRIRGARIGPFQPTGVCAPGLKKLHVTADGRFQPCESTGETMSIGDVDLGIAPGAVTRLQAGWLDALDGRCRDCWANRLCPLCYVALAPQWNGYDAGPAPLPESLCDKARAETEGLLGLYVQLLARKAERLEFLENSLMA